ncbi:MAG: NHLP leader peptide family RiPP precursor [Nostoc sp.]|uniref:NHLP leader peptide family RiPP precursor n=1 Tax=Nostoc sp. TaxID=1180 RepID=UPI002FFBA3AB
MHAELKKFISQSLNARAELEQKLIEQAWESETFKQELINNPKAVINRELRQQLPEDVEIEVLQETSKKVYLVLPENPAQVGSGVELSEEDLEKVAGGISVCLVITSIDQCINNSDTTGAQDLV